MKNDDIANFLNTNFHGYDQFPNNRVWMSFKDEDDKGDMRELGITHAGKDLAHIRIYYFGQDLPLKQIDKQQGNLKIEMQLLSYYEWEVFFEGYISDLTGLKFILNSIGIKFVE